MIRREGVLQRLAKAKWVRDVRAFDRFCGCGCEAETVVNNFHWNHPACFVSTTDSISFLMVSDDSIGAVLCQCLFELPYWRVEETGSLEEIFPGLRSCRWKDGIRILLCAIPYCSIVLALTLLSAWPLLNKQRPAKPKK